MSEQKDGTRMWVVTDLSGGNPVLVDLKGYNDLMETRQARLGANYVPRLNTPLRAQQLGTK